jgi:uncharacterized protein (TIGR03437 family)
MRRVLTRAGFLIVVVLSAAFYMQWTKFTAESAPIPIYCEAAAPEGIDPPLAQLANLIAGDGAADDEFGRSVAVSGDTLVVGASGDDIGANNNQGSAYVFVRSGGVWSFQQKLTANDGVTGDGFGRSVAISGDTVAVSSFSGNGSAYVFVRSGGVWSFQQKLVAIDAEKPDFFGEAVALSGDTIVISALQANIGTNIDQGAVYVFTRSGTVWSKPSKLIANDGAEGDNFGSSVAVSDGVIVVGAYLDKIGDNIDEGSVYVFARSGAVWSLQQKLTADDGAAEAMFGAAVAISGDTIVAGSPGARIATNDFQGAAYVFVRSGAAWSKQKKLTAAEGAASDYFGGSVAIHGGKALVGAITADIGAANNQGSVYLFSRSGADWTQRQKLTPQEGAAGDKFGGIIALGGDEIIAGAPTADFGANSNQGALYLFGCGYVEQKRLNGIGGGARDYFGNAVAIDGDTAVVGSPSYDVGTSSQGSVFVFTRNGAAWTQTARLVANDGVAGDTFGVSVSISGDYIVIGASGKTINGKNAQGAAYVFVRDDGAWRQQARLLAGDGAAVDEFGRSVSISDDRVAVGAPGADVGGKQNQGAVYLFTRSDSNWTPEVKLTANDGAANDAFGFSVALDGGALISGAPVLGVIFNTPPGAAYIFKNSDSTWKQRAKLTSVDGASADQFGYSVALSGQTALVGARLKHFGSTSTPGAAYVFIDLDDSSGNWFQYQRLSTGDLAASDQLGFSVAFSGDTAVVGAVAKTISGRAVQGAAFVFTRKGLTWSQRQSIVASDGSAAAQFGASVAVSGDTILVGAIFARSGQQGEAYVFESNCGPPLSAFASVSAASFDAASRLAPESIAAGFGSSLSPEIVGASSPPLPTTLGGLSVKLTDSNGIERLAPLFYVSPGQINYLIPPGAANGPATVTVTKGAVPVASGAAQISSVAPGLFSVGQGVAAGFALRVKAGGAQSYEPIVQFDPAQNRFVPAPIDLGPATDQVFLALYGTGVRFRRSLSAVSCAIGGVSSEVLYAGASPDYVGLDQVNVRLSRALIGRGAVDVALSVDDKGANTARISIR